MNSNQESTSRWLARWIAKAKGWYISGLALTLISAGFYIVFSWYLSEFSAL